MSGRYKWLLLPTHLWSSHFAALLGMTVGRKVAAAGQGILKQRSKLFQGLKLRRAERLGILSAKFGAKQKPARTGNKSDARGRQFSQNALPCLSVSSIVYVRNTTKARFSRRRNNVPYESARNSVVGDTIRELLSDGVDCLSKCWAAVAASTYEFCKRGPMRTAPGIHGSMLQRQHGSCTDGFLLHL